MQHLSPFSHHLQNLFMAELNNFASSRSSSAVNRSPFGQGRQAQKARLPGHAHHLLPFSFKRSTLNHGIEVPSWLRVSDAADHKARDRLRLTPETKADDLRLQTDPGLFTAEVRIRKQILVFSSSTSPSHPSEEQGGCRHVPQHPAKPQPELRGSRDSPAGQLREMQRSFQRSPASRSAPQPMAQQAMGRLAAFPGTRTVPAPSRCRCNSLFKMSF